MPGCIVDSRVDITDGKESHPGRLAHCAGGAGLLQETRAEVDDLLAKCRAYQERDDRVRIKEYDDLVSPNLTVHAFYVKYLLPIWFDVQSMERAPGTVTPGWSYA